MNYKALIISVLLAGFAIIALSVYSGYAVRDAEVADNAYEAGLRFDETAKQAARLGWRVDLPRMVKVSAGKAADLVIALSDRNGVLENAVVDVTLNRMGSRTERTYRCRAERGGRYRTPVLSIEQPGYWEATVRVARGNDALSFNETIQFQL